MASNLGWPHANLKGYLHPSKGNDMSKAPRADFALPGGRFPLNTPGRVQIADKDAAIARAHGTITAAEEATVKRKVAEKQHGGSTPDPAARMRKRLKGMTLAGALAMKKE